MSAINERDIVFSRFNVVVSAVTKSGVVVDKRTQHNIMTNVGRKWIRNLLGAMAYPSVGYPTPVSFGGISGAEKAQYVAVGCGGALQTNTSFLRTQTELVTVSTLEDPVRITDAPSDVWMQSVSPQNLTAYFPDDYTIKFEALFAETEISFVGNTTENSAVVVGTSVPVSEIGLFLSSADPSVELSNVNNSGKMIAYNIFTPITITPNVNLRIEWEFRA
jgi:hypothetical protein